MDEIVLQIFKCGFEAFGGRIVRNCKEEDACPTAGPHDSTTWKSELRRTFFYRLPYRQRLAYPHEDSRIDAVVAGQGDIGWGCQSG